MAKQNKDEFKNSLVEYNLVDLLEDRYGRYSKYIIQDRALPDVRDGLKPVQRRILYAMYKDGNHANRPYRKSAKTVGNVIGNYHPHGDSSVYEAMVRMSQSWKMNMMLIDMQGNNRSIDDDPAAAMRYTETRLAPLAHNLLSDIEEETVDFTLNFSDTELEPIVLPASYCNILVNGATGIASGYATNIPPFNLKEVMDACIYRLQNPTSPEEDIFNIIKAPDFPTGGIIQGKNGSLDILKTGQGKIVVRSKVEVVEAKKMTQLIVTEIPYEVVKQNLVRKIDELRFNDNITEILDVRDESDRNGIRIVVDLKKDADTQTILNLLYKQTDLQVNYNANMVVIEHSRPKRCGVIEIIDAYLLFRKEVVLKRTRYRHQKIEQRLHIIEGLMKALSYLDEVIEIIRGSKDRSDAKQNLITRFGFTDTQAESIITLRLYRLSNTDVVELKEEFAKLLNELEYLNSILTQEVILKNVIVKEFKAIIDQYGVDRKTQLEKEVATLTIDKTALIADEEVVVSLSRDGYIKRSSLRSVQATDQLYASIKEGDQLIGQVNTSLLNTMVFITKKGKYGLVMVNDIKEHRYKDVGSHISSMISVDYDDAIVSSFIVDDFNTDQYVMLVSKLGKIKKVLVRDFEVSRTSKVYKVMNLGKKDELVAAYLINDEDKVVLVTKDGYMSRYDESLVSTQSLNAAGVQSIKLSTDDVVVDSCVVNDHQELVILTTKFMIKRLKIDKEDITGRPVRGQLLAKKVKSNPNEVGAIYGGNLYDRLPVYSLDNEDVTFIKDVTLMNKDQTYSKFSKDCDYFVKSIDFTRQIIRDEKKELSPVMEQFSLDLD